MAVISAEAELARQTFEASARLAPGVFLGDGHHDAIVLVGTGSDGENEVVLLDITSDEAADASFDALQGLYQDKCLWYVSIVEMWTLPEDAELAPGERPSDRPDKIECLLVQGASRDGAFARSIAWRILRNGDTLDLVQHWDRPAHSERFERALFRKES